MHFNDIVWEAHRKAKENGFWDYPYNIGDETTGDVKNPLSVMAKLMLINSELIEAMTIDRVVDVAPLPNDHPELDKFGEELADVVIRLADLAGYLNIDMDYIINRKLEFNKNRPRKHGKRY